ncbi:hypothetical protein ACWGB8_11730 [Kitasatospora sp. NPDC054939]
MTAELPVPTPEQLAAAREFVGIREREGARELPDGVPAVSTIVGAWSNLMVRNLVRTRFALRRGDRAEAALGWAVVVEGLAWWARDPALPEELRAAAQAALGRDGTS